VEEPRRPGDPPRLIASSEKIKRELGWRPKFQSLEAIIESAWKWHEKFPDGYADWYCSDGLWPPMKLRMRRSWSAATEKQKALAE